MTSLFAMASCRLLQYVVNVCRMCKVTHLLRCKHKLSCFGQQHSVAVEFDYVIVMRGAHAHMVMENDQFFACSVPEQEHMAGIRFVPDCQQHALCLGCSMPSSS